MIGTVLNQRYRLEEELGRGGTGVVYRASDILLERPVAVKLLSLSALGTAARTRLLREAQTVARLNHPHIVTVYDAGETAGTPFFVMELVNGQSLRASSPLSVAQILTIAGQLCDALHYAHEQGVIHRDIKPENILLVQAGEELTAKLTDFGLARTVDSAHLTQEGAIVGTALYMAPELIQGQPVSPQSDLYALGATFYECLAARPPFLGENMLAILSQHVNAPAVPPSTFRPEIPPLLDQLICRLLSKQPAERPASALEVQRMLEAIQTAPVAPAPSELAPIERIARGRLVGRERELGGANAAWEKAMGGAGGVLLVSGEPGVGKTRFVRELVAQAHFQRAQVLRGECYAEGSLPYAPLAQAIQAADLAGLPERIVAELFKLAPALQRQLPAIAPNPPLDPQSEQERLYDSFVEWFLLLNQRKPTLLVVDDVHWADGGTLSLLRHLARRAARLQLRLLLVLTYREVELDGAGPLNDLLHDLNRERLAVRLKLSRLDRTQTGELLAALFAEEITPEFLDGIYRETEGNPFFVEEVCKALIEEGKVYREAGRWGRPGMEEIEIPQSIRLAVHSRLGRLPTAAQEVLSLAGAIGREFDFATLQSVSSLDEEVLIEALERAVRAQLIEEVRRPVGGAPAANTAFVFTHALIHSTLHEGLGSLRRQRVHRQVAAAVERLYPESYEALAYHHAQSGDAERARFYYLRAGRRALAAYAHQDAEKYLRAAVQLSGPAADTSEALAGLGEALYGQGRFSEAIATWREATALYQAMGDADALAFTYARMCGAARENGEIAAAAALGEEGLALVGGRPPGKGLAALLRETGNASVRQGLWDQGLSLHRRALEVAEGLDDPREQAEASARLGFDLAFRSATEREQGREYLQQAVELAERVGALQAAGLAHNYLGQYERDFAGRIDTAIEHFARAVELARQTGMATDELFSLGLLWMARMFLGDFQGAAEFLSRGRHLLQLGAGSGAATQLFHVCEAAIAWQLGDWAGAVQTLEGVRAATRQRDDMNYFVLATEYLGLLLIQRGRWAEVESILSEASRLAKQEAGPLIHGQLAVAHSRQGKLTEARESIEQTRALAGPEPTGWGLWAVAASTAHLAWAEGQWEDAWSAFQTAAGLLERTGARWLRVGTLKSWAEAHLARGQDEDLAAARGLLAEAQQLYEAMGASTYAGEVQRLLEQIGG